METMYRRFPRSLASSSTSTLLSAVTALVVASGLPACGGSSGSGNGDGPDGGSISLAITPTSTEVDLDYGTGSEVSFEATATLADGSTEDVTTGTSFAVTEAGVGLFDGAVLELNGKGAGLAHVTARYKGATATAEVTVKISDVVIDPSAPADAPGWFDSATDQAALAPAVVYPQDGTLVPRNLGDFETHWTGPTGEDLFQITLAGEYATLVIYTAGDPAGSYVSLSLDQWSLLSGPATSSAFTITARGMASASHDTAGTSAPVRVSKSTEDVRGGIYYWASAGALPEGVYRHDMSRPGEPAEQFYTTAESPRINPADPQSDGRCVACHSLSRDGERMAITFDGGNGSSTVLDIATRTPVVALDTYAWNFATFTADHGRAVTSHQGVLTLRDGDSMAPIGTVPEAGYATQPEFSPDGTHLAYVVPSGPINNQDWTFTGGTIVIRSYDAATDTFGDASTVMPNPGDHNVYYPSWSPDSQWLAFNESTGDSYNDPDAEVYVIKADRSVGPIVLDTVNLAGSLDNSWVRWAPFEQTLHGGAGDEPLFWLTFSSKRAFGVRLPAGRPQVWMAPFFPERASAGSDPTAPAFRLPFQEISTSNHIAQWTEKVVNSPD